MHQFIFTPGYWIGEGKVTFSASPEELHFYTKWLVKEKEDDCIVCEQTVEMQGNKEHVNNRFLISDVTDSDFTILLENDLIGEVRGKGVIDDKTVGWEFRADSGLEGFETFRKEEGGDYIVHAEYASQDQFRSIIDATIWLKDDLP